MPLTHVPHECVADARETRKTSRRRLLGAAAASGALVAGGLTFSKAQPAGAQEFTAQQNRSFSSSTPINIPDNSNGEPYGSPIIVSGMVGDITKVTLSIFGFHHTNPEDVEIMLVSPTSVGKVVMAGVGGAFPVQGANLVITDDAQLLMPDNALLTTGNYKPTNHLENPPSPGTSFGSPAPSPVLGENFIAFLSLSGANINGSWRLFVKDAVDNQLSGRITGGWSLRIETNIDEPVVRNDSYTVKAGETLNVRRPGVLENDRDNTGGGLRVSKVIRRSNRLGRLTLKRNGSLTFVARRNVSGRFRFRYRAVSRSGLSGTARVTIRVQR